MSQLERLVEVLVESRFGSVDERTATDAAEALQLVLTEIAKGTDDGSVDHTTEFIVRNAVFNLRRVAESAVELAARLRTLQAEGKL